MHGNKFIPILPPITFSFLLLVCLSKDLTTILLSSVFEDLPVHVFSAYVITLNKLLFVQKPVCSQVLPKIATLFGILLFPFFFRKRVFQHIMAQAARAVRMNYNYG